jgi:hypothetical protein
VQAEVLDMMIGINIDGVFMDTQVGGVIRDNAREVEEGEEVLATKIEGVDAIVDIEALENHGKVFVELE